MSIIVIGQCRLDLTIDADGNKATTSPGGTLLAIANTLAYKGHTVKMVSEVARDAVGDQLMESMTRTGVDTTSVDRYTEGTTAAAMYYTDGRQVCYGTYPSEPMSVVWPRIERGDIVVFGGAYTLEPRVHTQTMELLRYAHDLKATVVYVPLYPPRLKHRVTHAMPAVLDSFESATIAVIDRATIETLYGSSDMEQVYRRHLSYYDAPMLTTGTVGIDIYRPAAADNIPVSTAPDTVGLTVALVESLKQLSATPSMLANDAPSDLSHELLTTIVQNLCQQY